MGASQRPTHSAHARQRAHEMAQLRARRAARRSAEFASGQRRMAAAGVFTALTVVTGLSVAFSEASSWLWTLLPIAGLFATLALSRLATVRAERADAADKARMAELLRHRHSVPSSPSSYEVPAASSSASAEVSSRTASSRSQLAPGGESEKASEGGVSEATASSPAAGLHDAASPEVLAPLPTEADGSSSVDDGQEIQASVERTWTPRALPVSRYSQRRAPRAQVVHADTDLRGIPRVSSNVPARPIAPTVDPQARSTEDVAASVPLAFNLDDILEARRA